MVEGRSTMLGRWKTRKLAQDWISHVIDDILAITVLMNEITSQRSHRALPLRRDFRDVDCQLVREVFPGIFLCLITHFLVVRQRELHGRQIQQKSSQHWRSSTGQTVQFRGLPSTTKAVVSCPVVASPFRSCPRPI